jgi:hypothetical protein
LSVITGAIDAAIYTAEGDYVEAGIAAASMIPGGKVITTAGKVAKRAVSAARVAKEPAKLKKRSRLPRPLKKRRKTPRWRGTSMLRRRPQEVAEARGAAKIPRSREGRRGLVIISDREAAKGHIEGSTRQDEQAKERWKRFASHAG